MSKMNKRMRLSLVALACIAAVGAWIVAASAGPATSSADSVKISSLVKEMRGIDSSKLENFEAVAVRPYEIPDDSVDVMRARITETYAVDGVGQDTVELSGWVAIKHFNAHPVDGATDLTWNTAVIDTQFVGLEMNGYSKLFGPVQVRLDESRPVQGQVGRIQIPELAKVALLAALDKGAAEKGAATTSKPATDQKQIETQQEELLLPGACVAEVQVAVNMPQLNLHMATKTPVHWYSLVDTIPPVGHRASIAVEPVRLTSEGREVATLMSGKVHFREVVRRVMLADSADVKVAQN